MNDSICRSQPLLLLHVATQKSKTWPLYDKTGLCRIIPGMLIYHGSQHRRFNRF